MCGNPFRASTPAPAPAPAPVQAITPPAAVAVPAVRPIRRVLSGAGATFGPRGNAGALVGQLDVIRPTL